MGDFNCITKATEKQGGRLYASSSSNGLVSFMNDFGLVDLGFAGHPFTWNNKLLDSHNWTEELPLILGGCFFLLLPLNTLQPTNRITNHFYSTLLPHNRPTLARSYLNLCGSVMNPFTGWWNQLGNSLFVAALHLFSPPNSGRPNLL